jgi:hypothetical protein
MKIDYKNALYTFELYLSVTFLMSLSFSLFLVFFLNYCNPLVIWIFYFSKFFSIFCVLGSPDLVIKNSKNFNKKKKKKKKKLF